MSNITTMTLDETTRMFDVTTHMDGLLVGTAPNSESNGTNTTIVINFNTRHTVYWVFNVVTVLVGLVGNVLVVPLMRDAKLYYLSFPVYLRFLSFSDSAVLIIFGIKESFRYFQSYYLIGGNLVVCMLLKFMQYTVTQLSPWLVVGLTLDRFYCVVFPLKRDRLCTRRKATIICSCLTAVSVVMSIPLMYDIKVVKGRDTICVVSDLLMSYFASVRLVFNSTLPCAMILVLSIVIGFHIQRSAAFRQRFTANTTSTRSTTTTNTTSSTTTNTASSTTTNTTGSTTTNSGTTAHKQDKSLRPLMLISILAFVTIIPLAITDCVLGILMVTKSDFQTVFLLIKLWPMFNMLYQINFGQNFYILMASSANYRKIAKSKLKCKRATRNENVAVSRVPVRATDYVDVRTDVTELSTSRSLHTGSVSLTSPV